MKVFIVVIHIVFSSSAAGTLRQALRARGKREAVVDLTDNLDWGPPADEGFERRASWLDCNIPWEDCGWGWIADDASKFQAKVDRDADRLIWIAPQSASEQCGLCWYLDKFGGHGTSMIVADYPLSGAWLGQRHRSLGELGVEQIGALLDQGLREPWNAARFSDSRWRELCAEDLLLRIVDQSDIKSVSEDHFDNYLLTRCTQDWKKWSRIVGEAMAHLGDEAHDADSVFLAWRLRVLAESGIVESSGEIMAFPSPDRETVLVRAIAK